MVSYLLIGLVCTSVMCSKFVSKNITETHDAQEFNNSEPQPDFVQAIARFDTPQWKMVVVTDMTMSQLQWDQTLELLTNNIRDLERVV